MLEIGAMERISTDRKTGDRIRKSRGVLASKNEMDRTRKHRYTRVNVKKRRDIT